MTLTATVAGIKETFFIVLGCVMICVIAHLVQRFRGKKGE